MNSIIFFIIVIGIDLFLKSIKDKKKIEEARRKRMEDLERSKPRVDSHIKATEVEAISLEDMLKQERRRQDESMDIRDYKVEIEDSFLRDSLLMHGEFQYIKDDDMMHRKGHQYGEKKLKKKPEENKTEESDLQKDILRGIIFSEILSEAKSIQNMKRGM